MPELSLQPAAPRRAPLDAASHPLGPDFALSAGPTAARYILRGDGEVRRLAGAAFGLELPAIACRAATKDTRSAIWLGPDEWLLLIEGAEPSAFEAEAAAALGERPHSLTDVSHRQISLIARGARATRALSAGCPLDLRLAAFPVGMATRTIFDKAEIVLWRRGETTFHLEVWRSFAPYIAAALTEAARGAPAY